MFCLFQETICAFYQMNFSIEEVKDLVKCYSVSTFTKVKLKSFGQLTYFGRLKEYILYVESKLDDDLKTQS